jgi:hypothetical protein
MAKTLGDLGIAAIERALVLSFDHDEIAGGRVAQGFAIEPKLAASASLERPNHQTVSGLFEHTDNFRRARRQNFDDPAFVLHALDVAELRKHAISDLRRAAPAVLNQVNLPARRILDPASGLGQEIAVVIEGDDIGHDHAGETAVGPDALFVAARQQSVALELTHHGAEISAFLAFEAEGARQVAPGHLFRRFGEIADQFVLAR